MQRDYYEVLGLQPTAGQDEIKKAYRQLIRKYHPDLNHASSAEEALKEVIAAYKVLGDPKQRATYDKLNSLYGNRSAKSTSYRYYSTWPVADAPPKTHHDRHHSGLSAYVFALIIVGLFIAVLKGSGQGPHMKQWKASPAMEGFLSQKPTQLAEQTPQTESVEQQYIWYCIKEYHEKPNDRTFAKRLADAYISAAKTAAGEQNKEKARTLAHAAENVMGGKYPPAERMLSQTAVKNTTP